MLNLKRHSVKSSTLSHSGLSLATIAVLLGSMVIAPLSVSAQPLFRQRAFYNQANRPSGTYYPRFSNGTTISQSFSNTVIPAGTSIPLTSADGNSIQVRRGETRALTLQTAANLRSSNGAILVPAGSQVSGQLRPSQDGVVFIAQSIKLSNGQELNLNARSQELYGFETKSKGASAFDVITGTLAGAGTATIVAGTTGDRRIDALEVLGGAAAGALAGWGLPTAGVLGGGSEEIMTINPSQDLTVTLQSPLSLNGNSVSYTGDYDYNRNSNVW